MNNYISLKIPNCRECMNDGVSRYANPCYGCVSAEHNRGDDVFHQLTMKPIQHKKYTELKIPNCNACENNHIKENDYPCCMCTGTILFRSENKFIAKERK